MTITTQLAVPLINQLAEPTADSQPDENARENCLFACCAADLRYVTGKPYDGDQIKDAVMGQGYVGFGYFSQALRDYMVTQGVTVRAVGGIQAALTYVTHSWVDAKTAVLAVIPSAWNGAYTTAQLLSPNFPTHVVLFAGEGAGELRAMNPWGGFWQDNSDQWWQGRICYGAVWPLVAQGGIMGIPLGWKDDGSTLTAPNGVTVIHGFRDHILNAPSWPGALVPLAAEYGVAVGHVVQKFALELDWTAAANVTEQAGTLPTVVQTDPKADAALAALQQFKAALADV